MKLRDYQLALKSEIYQAWQSGARNVLAVMPTGAGKTATFSNILSEHRAASVAIAHRSELVSQMSLALARNGVVHRVIGPPALGRGCAALHIAELSRNYVSPNARCAVASVDTLIRRDGKEPWFTEVTLWITDEAAHLTAKNKWGQAVNMFPNARGLGVTATPCRADGQGLGRHHDGVIDVMVQGPTMRDLITEGWLTEYRIFAPPSDIDLSQVKISASGDFSPQPLAKAVHKSHIVGDVVQHYLRIAAGKLGATFCVDVESACEIATAYKMAGVPTEVISAKTPDMLRSRILQRFRNREILQLCSVDIFSEGFDLPAIEVITMARPTQSYGLYVQQFGRGIRPLEGKTHAIVIDHVGNTLRHGLPDAPREWTLDRRERRSRDAPTDVIPIRVCNQCLAAYERVLTACPYCGVAPLPASRGTPDMVDGDLAEMSPELLARLRGEADKPLIIPYGATPVIEGAVRKKHRERLAARDELVSVMALWGGWRTSEGDGVAEQQRRFFHQFGTDVLSAQGMNRADCATLQSRIESVLTKNKIDVTVTNG